MQSLRRDTGQEIESERPDLAGGHNLNMFQTIEPPGLNADRGPMGGGATETVAGIESL